MSGPQGSLWEGAVHKHLGFLLNQGLDLGLPLFRSGKAGSGQQFQHLVWSFGVAQQFVVIAAGGHWAMGSPAGDYLVAFALPETE